MASSFPTPGQYRSEKNGSCFKSCLHTNMDPRILSQAPIHAGLHTQGVIDSRRSGLPLSQTQQQLPCGASESPTALLCLEEDCHEIRWSGCSGPGFHRGLQSLSPKDYKGHQQMFPGWPQAMTLKLPPPWPHLIVYNWHSNQPHPDGYWFF